MESTSPSFPGPTKYRTKRHRDGVGGCGDSVVTANPLKLNPTFRHPNWGPENIRQNHPLETTLSRTPDLPSAQKLLPTGIIFLGNYLEIGNALPYRKNCFQELFGPVIVIKSVMESVWPVKSFFDCVRKAWESSTPSPPSSTVGIHFRELFR